MIAIEEIYAAAFDRERLPQLVRLLADAFGAQAGFIGWSDPARDSGFHAEYGNDPAWLAQYVQTYREHDILLPLLQALPEGGVDTVWSHLQRPEVRDSVFYREYLAPQQIVDNLAVVLFKREAMFASLALLRRGADAVPFTDADREAIGRLVPHLRRAVLVQSQLVRAADHLAGIRALEGSGDGALLLVDANRVVTDADPVLSAALALRTGETIGDRALDAALAAAIATREPVAIELAKQGDGDPLRLLIEARAVAANRFGELAGGASPSHAVHFTFLDQPRTVAFDAIGALYRLTPTELRVLRDAIEHGDLMGIGSRLGMARATARTHLHRIYDKTSTGNFARLSNLAHRFGRIARQP